MRLGRGDKGHHWVSLACSRASCSSIYLGRRASSCRRRGFLRIAYVTPGPDHKSYGFLKTAQHQNKSRHHVIVSSGWWSYQAGRVAGEGSGTWRLSALHSAHPPMDQRSWNSSDGCTSGTDRKLKGEHLLAATCKATETQEHAGSEGRANRMRSVAHELFS